MIMKESTLPLKIPMGMRKYFSESYRKFGHQFSKRFASRALDISFMILTLFAFQNNSNFHLC
jgi:hypothetical protein